jgi:hypothetical protein
VDGEGVLTAAHLRSNAIDSPPHVPSLRGRRAPATLRQGERQPAVITSRRESQ